MFEQASQDLTERMKLEEKQETLDPPSSQELRQDFGDNCQTRLYNNHFNPLELNHFKIYLLIWKLIEHCKMLKFQASSQ